MSPVHICVGCPICKGDMCLTTHEIIYEYNKKIIREFLDKHYWDIIQRQISKEDYIKELEGEKDGIN